MAEKVLFTRHVEMIPTRKGLFQDPMLDFNGFSLLVVGEEEIEKGCGKKPKRTRKWGEDPEYDAVMRNFGMTPGKEGEEARLDFILNANTVVLCKCMWKGIVEGEFCIFAIY